MCGATRSRLFCLEVARKYLELRGLERRLEITNQNIQLAQDSLDLARVGGRRGARQGLGTQPT